MLGRTFGRDTANGALEKRLWRGCSSAWPYTETGEARTQVQAEVAEIFLG